MNQRKKLILLYLPIIQTVLASADCKKCRYIEVHIYAKFILIFYEDSKGVVEDQLFVIHFLNYDFKQLLHYLLTSLPT